MAPCISSRGTPCGAIYDPGGPLLCHIRPKGIAFRGINYCVTGQPEASLLYVCRSDQGL